jgi:hypothetical protein
MLLKFRLIALLFIIYPISSFANCTDADDACWKKEWKELCSYDVGYEGTEWCKKIVNDDQSWKKPKWEVRESLKSLGPIIIETGKKYGVDPRAIAGAVYAENSINVTRVDDFEDFLVKWKIAKNGKIPIINKPFSFGWGQLYIEAAREAEPIVAMKDGRPIRSDEEIAQALQIPEEAMKYIAAVMSRIQDIYQKNGIDISQKPEILATVYNLGKPEKLVEITKIKGGVPRVNFFGFFVKHNLKLLQNDIGYSDKIVASAMPVTTPIKKTKKDVPTTNLVEKVAVTKHLVLYRTPPRCGDDDSSKKASYIKVASFEKPEPASSIKVRDTYEVLSPGLGCRLNGDKEAWSLIRSENGVTGWVSEDSLNKATVKILKEKKTCVSDNSCELKLSKITKIKKSEKDGGSILLNLSSKDQNGKNVSWKNPDILCESMNNGGGGNNKPGIQVHYSRGTSYKKSKFELASNKDVEQILSNLEILENKVMTTFGLQKEYGSRSGSSPYDSILNEADNFKIDLKKCITNNGESPTQSCYFDKEQLNALLNIPTITKDPTYKEWKKVRDSIMPDSYGIVPLAIDKVVKEEDPKDLLIERKKSYNIMLVDCFEIDNTLKESKNYIQRIKDSIENMNIYSDLSVNGYSALSRVREACKIIKEISKSSKDCTECATNVGRLNFMEFDLSFVKNILKSTTDKDEYLADQLKLSVDERLLASGGGGGPMESCGSYDPETTAKEISEILKIPCVKTVYVPDPWLIKKFSNETKKVIFRNFISNDQYAIDTTTMDCAAGETK